jgi:RNA polymerase sigma factor (sigma-70 family)
VSMNRNPSRLQGLDTKPLSNQEHVVLVKRARRGDKAARTRLVEHSMGLVFRLANMYVRRTLSLEVDDLAAEGALGILHAIKKFDPSLGKFSTYAYSWIRAYITRATNLENSVAHIPFSAAESVKSVEIRRSKLFPHGLSSQELDTRLVEEFGVGAVRNERAVSLVSKSSSLDAPIGDMDLCLHDVVSGDESEVERIVKLDTIRRIRDVIGKLRPRLNERELAVLDDVLLGGGTLQAVGDRFGFTREYARIIAKSLQSLLKARLQKAVADEIAELSSEPIKVRKFERSVRVLRFDERPVVAPLPTPKIRTPRVAANGLRVGDVVMREPQPE